MQTTAQTNDSGHVAGGKTKPVLGLPFKVGERKTFHSMSFIEILPTGKINGVSLELLGPVARTSSEYAEFIVRAANAHDDLVAALRDARERMMGSSPAIKALIAKTDSALAKAGAA